MTPLLCVLPGKTVYYIFFGHQRSCLHIEITLLRWLIIHLLDIHELFFYCMHLCMHEKGSMWPFYNNLVNITLLWMDSP